MFGALAALVIVYFALPGHPALPAHGLPLGPAGTVLVSAAIVLAVVLRRARISRTVQAVSGTVMVALLVARVAMGFVASPVGWMARYYANDQWAWTPEWSSDFPRLAATRIDPRISFKDDTFPAHYLNDPAFNRGIRREVSEPMSVEWNGFAFVEAGQTARLSLRARGDATLHIDGREVLSLASSSGARAAETMVDLAAGRHTLSVRYRKPVETEGLIDLTTDATVVPTDRAPTGRWLFVAAHLVDAGLLITFACVAFHAVRTMWPFSVVPAALFAIFGFQGWWQARGFAGRVVSLTSGDDWFGFESCARDILHHGPLMTLGRPVGQGAPYFYHPLYCYFLAVVHAITGETLFGPVFVQFLILALVAVLVWRLAASLFAERPALAGLCVLVLILELDFTRYYTVTLLSENLYVLPVTLTLVSCVLWVREGERADLWLAGFWGGVSSITRPAMMMYFVPVLALVAFISAERARTLRASVASVGAVAAAWMLVIAPVTLRNWVVAHRLVLISDGLGAGFIKYNMPASADPALYTANAGNGILSGLAVLGHLTWDHPLEMLLLQGRKLGFSLGMVQWFGGYRPHPELVAVTLLYAVMCILSRAMRARALWPVHLFVLAHLASMGFTMPWNYGYRLIIPPFIYTSSLSAAAAYSLLAMRAFRLDARQATESRV